jgi:hypothetical protein
MFLIFVEVDASTNASVVWPPGSVALQMEGRLSRDLVETTV